MKETRDCEDTEETRRHLHLLEHASCRVLLVSCHVGHAVDGPAGHPCSVKHPLHLRTQVDAYARCVKRHVPLAEGRLRTQPVGCKL